MAALKSLLAHEQMERKRVAAEDRAGIKALTGEDMGADEDELGDLILGDRVTNVSETGGNFGKLAGMALLAGAIGGPLAFLGSQWINRPTPPQPEIVDTDTDSRTELKILR